MSDERARRWRLALGGDQQDDLSERDRRMDQALSALYENGSGSGAKAGLGRSAPKVARWLGDIREFFPTPVVKVIQRDAFERLNLKAMLMQPDFLSTLEVDIHLVADLLSLRSVMPERVKETARLVVRQLVESLMARLAHATAEAVRGALDQGRRTRRPRPADIDWPATIRANLRHWQADFGTLVPERLVGRARRMRNRTEMEQVILCADQSGSMASSVVYSSIFASVMASVPALDMRLICFDTSVVDLTEELADPVDLLFGIQLGGGTDINRALAYCQELVTRPSKTHLVLITDLGEGGNGVEMLERAGALVGAGVNLIVLLALSDDGRPSFDAGNAQALAALGCPVFACTPDQFPDMMAHALKRQDLHAWASARDIAAVRAG